MQVETEIKITKWSDCDTTHKVLSFWFLSSLALIIFFACLSFFSNVSVTINIVGIWLFIYIFSMVSICGSCIWLIYRSKNVTVESTGGIFKKLFSMILGTLGAAILFAESIFSGLPILLHHASEHQGNMHVTVIDKKLRGSRYQCSPALIIEEFNWFGSNRICIDDQMYSQFGIGDTLIANGMVSSFAIEVESITRK